VLEWAIGRVGEWESGRWSNGAAYQCDQFFYLFAFCIFLEEFPARRDRLWDRFAKLCVQRILVSEECSFALLRFTRNYSLGGEWESGRNLLPC